MKPSIFVVGAVLVAASYLTVSTIATNDFTRQCREICRPRDYWHKENYRSHDDCFCKSLDGKWEIQRPEVKK